MDEESFIRPYYVICRYVIFYKSFVYEIKTITKTTKLGVYKVLIRPTDTITLTETEEES